MKNIFNTPLGTSIKAFLSVVISLYLAELADGHQLFQFDWVMWQKILTGALVSTLPAIINWLNPNYVQYGRTRVDKKIAKIEKEIEAREDEPHTEKE